MERLEVQKVQEIFDVLVNTCGASEALWDMFQRSVKLNTDNSLEFRFRGALGLGGKFHINRDRWFISCYGEDKTLERLAVINQANKELAQLRG